MTALGFQYYEHTKTASSKLTMFDPWAPIESLLFELDSNSVQNSVARVGLSINWQLNKTPAYSQKTRNRAYRECVSQAYPDLTEDEKIEFATNVAKELSNISPAYKERINEVLKNIGWVFVQNHLLPKEAVC